MDQVEAARAEGAGMAARAGRVVRGAGAEGRPVPPPSLVHVWLSRRAGKFGQWHELIPRVRPPASTVRFGVRYHATGGVTVQFGVGPKGHEEPWMEVVLLPGGEDYPVVFERDVLVGSRVAARVKSSRPNEIVEVRVRLKT